MQIDNLNKEVAVRNELRPLHCKASTENKPYAPRSSMCSSGKSAAGPQLVPLLAYRSWPPVS